MGYLKREILTHFRYAQWLLQRGYTATAAYNRRQERGYLFKLL